MQVSFMHTLSWINENFGAITTRFCRLFPFISLLVYFFTVSSVSLFLLHLILFSFSTSISFLLPLPIFLLLLMSFGWGNQCVEERRELKIERTKNLEEERQKWERGGRKRKQSAQIKNEEESSQKQGELVLNYYL